MGIRWWISKFFIKMLRLEEIELWGKANHCKQEGRSLSLILQEFKSWPDNRDIIAEHSIEMVTSAGGTVHDGDLIHVSGWKNKNNIILNPRYIEVLNNLNSSPNDTLKDLKPLYRIPNPWCS